MKKFIGLAISACLAFLVLCSLPFGARKQMPQTAEAAQSPSISSSIDTGSVELVQSKTRFDVASNFDLTFKVTSASEIKSFSVETSGLTVNSKKRSGNKIIINVKCKSEISPSLYVKITLENGSILKSHAFGYVSSEGIFISPYSVDNAFERYNTYLLDNGFQTSKQYEENERKYYDPEYEKKEEIEREVESDPSIPAYISSSINYVRGTIRWRDDGGAYHPAQFIKIEIYDEDTFSDELLGTVYTDLNGQYSFTYTNQTGWLENGGCDIYVKIYAEGTDIAVKRENGEVYVWTSPVYDDQGKDSDIPVTTPGSHDFGMENDIGQAVQISQAAITASRYAEAMAGTDIDDIDIYYPAPDNRTHYEPWERICLVGPSDPPSDPSDPFLQSYASWDVIMHEYGHHVQRVYDITSGQGGTHYIQTDMAEHYYDDTVNRKALCSRCSNNNATLVPEREIKTRGINLAWGEAFPTVFGCMAQQYYISNLANIDTVGDTLYSAYNLSRGYDNEINNNVGEANESAIIGLLWDLFDDTTTESFDRISLTHQRFWDIVTGSEAKTLSEFVSYLNNGYAVSKSALGELLAHYHFSAPETSETIGDIYSLPTFSWTRGGTNNFPQDKIQVVFYDRLQYEICRSASTNRFSITLTESTWNKVLQTEDDYFYWAVESYNEDSYGVRTGPYVSQFRQVNKPKITGLATYVTLQNELDEGSYHWYKYTAISSGTFTFFTTGSTDTYGEIFSKMTYGKTTENRIAYNDDVNGSSDRNFSITVSLIYGQTVYLRVRGFNYTATGKYSLRLSFDEHIHDYHVRYEYLNTTHHRWYCDCGLYIDEEHDFRGTGTKARCAVCGYTAYAPPGSEWQSVDSPTSNCSYDNVDLFYDKKE